MDYYGKGENQTSAVLADSPSYCRHRQSHRLQPATMLAATLQQIN